MLKRDLVRENTKLVKQAEMDAKTISKLTTINGQYTDVVTKAAYDAMKHEKSKEIEDLKIEILDLEEEAEKTNDALNICSMGRTLLLQTPWYERIFLKESTIRKILIFGKL